MLKIMSYINSFNASKKFLLRAIVLAGITVFAACNHITNRISYGVINSIKSIICKGLTCISSIANVVRYCIAIETVFLANYLKKFFRYLPNKAPIETSVFHIMVSDNEVSSIASFLNSITYKFSSLTSTRLDIPSLKNSVFNLMNPFANALADPISSNFIFSSYYFSFYNSKEPKLFIYQINHFSHVDRLDLLYNVNEVKHA